ncbi:MAG: hypothetical protein GYB41_00940 [Oceanospirillales bacterium]|nr:hypothetical protein [Oceanospirillales bacterium]
MRRHLSRAWWLSVILLLLLALLLTAARVLLQSVDRWRPDLEAYLSQTLGAPVVIGLLHGQWNYAYPVLTVDRLDVRTPAASGPEGQLVLDRLTLELDPFASLLARAPIFNRFEAQGARVRWHQRSGAWLHRPGAAPEAPAREGISIAAWERLLAVLLQQPYAVIRDVELVLVPEQGQSLVISPADIELENAPNKHRLSGLFRMPLLGEATEMAFVVETESVLEPNALDARYRVFFDMKHLGPELFRLFGREWGVEQLDLNTRIWSEFEHRRLQSAQAEVALSQLALTSPGVPYPQSARVDISVQPRGDHYQLQLERLQLAHEQARFELPLLMLQGSLPWSGRPDGVQAGIPELDMEALSSWLATAPGMPTAAAALLGELQVRGRLQQLSVDMPVGGNWQALQLTADLEQLQVSAWHGAPALAGVSGRLEAGMKSGRIDLDSTDFSMHFPELYPQHWNYQQAQGRIKWAVDQRGVRVGSEHLQLRNEHVNAGGRFSIDLPFDQSRQSELVLMIGMTDSDGRQAPVYTPADAVGQGLHRWLEQALKSGKLRQGGLLLRTGTRRLQQPASPVVQLFFDIADGQLAYQPGWPAITAGDLYVLVRDAGVAININRAKLLQSDIPSGWVYLPPGEHTLQVETLLQGPVSDLDHILKQTPLAQLLGSPVQEWTLDRGQAKTRLSLAIPLVDSMTPAVEVTVALDQARLRRQTLEVSGISGELNYHHGVGLSADKLQGSFLGQPVQARIDTQEQNYRVQLQGQSEMTQLQQWLQLPILEASAGLAQWQAQLDLCREARCPQLTVRSDLQGVGLTLPGILAKTAEQSAPLALTLGLMPEVHVQALDLRLPADGIVPLQVRAAASGSEPLRVRLDHPQLSGEVALASSTQPLTLHLEHLQLDALMPAAESVANGVQPSSVPTPHQLTDPTAIARLPLTAVRIRDLWFDGKPLGEWRFRLQPAVDGLQVRDLEASLEQLTVRGELDWVQSETPYTATSLTLAGKDLGRLLKTWGYGRVMETEQLDGMLQLQWSGAPWQFAPDDLDGEFIFDLGNTRLIETTDSSNILRVFGILNFNSLARRLRLDFSDLFKKGISFDSINGHYRLENGVARTVKPLRLQGPSANMQLSGEVNLVTEQLNKSVEVTLPLSSNAPLAAVLLGAPQVAGAVFVIDKLIGDRLERFSTLSYRLSGHWDDPQLELQVIPEG